LQDEPVDSGFYFTENGVLVWDELYQPIIGGLRLERKVRDARDEELVQMAKAIKCDKDLSRVRFSGRRVRG